MAEGQGKRQRPRIGLALGGGGARGFAHIPVLEAFDELGVRPAMIAGTSIGRRHRRRLCRPACRGARSASTPSSAFSSRSEVLARAVGSSGRSASASIFAQGTLTIGQFNAERILEAFLPNSLPATFAELSPSR